MNQTVFMPNVKYLEISDVTSNWKLKPYVTEGKPTIVMVQGKFCGWCTKAKPDYARFQQNSKVSVCTIQSDGAESEKELYKGIPNWDAEFLKAKIACQSDSNLTEVRIRTIPTDALWVMTIPCEKLKKVVN